LKQGVAFWKELNSRMPSLGVALREFFKFNDGSGSPLPKVKDTRNQITLFLEKNKGNKKTIEYIDPSIHKVVFSNDNGSLNARLQKKRLDLSWDGDIKCLESENTVSCSITGPITFEPVKSPIKANFRHSDAGKKLFKRSVQTRSAITLPGSVNLWTEAKTNIRDINQIALFGSAGIASVGMIGAYFLPAMGLLTLASPMLFGATTLANSEAVVRNNNGEWFVDADFKDDKWISDIDIPSSKIRSIEIIQDDEFYFHGKINLAEPLKCKVTEESDTLSLYPIRKLDCKVT
jgi:hypothetical protein